MVGVPGREGVGNPTDYLLDGDPFYLITYYAEHEAEKRAEADLIIDDPLSDAEIQDYAKEAWERSYNNWEKCPRWQTLHGVE